jgi:cytochrome c-type biogenesis protein CcmE
MSSGRARFVVAAAVAAASILGLIAWALAGSTAYYKTPAELAAGKVGPGEKVRVAGKVVAGTVAHRGPETDFTITDGKTELPVTTRDVLPDTFGPGIEVVAEGGIAPGGIFSASTVLAKCPSKFKAKVSKA